MGREQQFVSLLVLLLALGVWYNYRTPILAAYARVSAPGVRADGTPAGAGAARGLA